MSDELDRSAREVIDAGREGVVPDHFTAERIRHAVKRTLEGTIAMPRSRIRPIPMLAAVGVAALVGVLYASELVRTRATPAPTATPAPVAPAERAPVVSHSTAAPEPATEASTAAAPEAPPESTRVPSADRPTASPSARTQNLAAEIELLARVNAAVNAGNGAKALELLGEYDREFRPAILGEERAAAQVLALCAAGRTADARAAAQRFHGKWPRSPHAPRLSQSCVGTR